jgi:formylmethanofuran dehydrogenase subunit E
MDWNLDLDLDSDEPPTRAQINEARAECERCGAPMVARNVGGEASTDLKVCVSVYRTGHHRDRHE